MAKKTESTAVVAADALDLEDSAQASELKPGRKPSTGGAVKKLGPGQRGHYVEVAAYFIAERRGFAPGDPVADWIAAESQVDALIAQGKLGT